MVISSIHVISNRPQHVTHERHSRVRNTAPFYVLIVTRKREQWTRSSSFLSQFGSLTWCLPARSLLFFAYAHTSQFQKSLGRFSRSKSTVVLNSTPVPGNSLHTQAYAENQLWFWFIHNPIGYRASLKHKLIAYASSCMCSCDVRWKWDSQDAKTHRFRTCARWSSSVRSRCPPATAR